MADKRINDQGQHLCEEYPEQNYSNDKKGPDIDKLQGQQAFEHLDKHQLLHNADEEPKTETVLSHHLQQQHQKQFPQHTTMPQYQQHHEEQVHVASSSVAHVHDQRQEARMHEQKTETWLSGDNSSVGVVEEVITSNITKDTDFGEASVDPPANSDVFGFENPDFLQMSGAAGGPPLATQQVSGDNIWNFIGTDNSILDSFMCSESSEEHEDKYSLGTILDVLGINQESETKEQSSSPQSSPMKTPSHIQTDANQHESFESRASPDKPSMSIPQSLSSLQQQQTSQGISASMSKPYFTNAGETLGTHGMSASRDDAALPGSIPVQRLPESYELVVRGYYRTREMFKVSVATKKGCVLFYKEPESSPTEDLTNVSLVQYPEITEESKSASYTKRVLDVMKKGVFIHERDGFIYATRRCRSKVYFSSSQDITGDAKELQRNEETVVFNTILFEKRNRDWLMRTDYSKGTQPRPPNIVFTFAQMWSWHSYHPLMNCLVYAVVTPMRARTQLEWGPRDDDLSEVVTQHFDAERTKINARVCTTLTCRKCGAFACHSDDIRCFKAAHYVVITDKFHKMYYTIENRRYPLKTAELDFQKTIICKTCRLEWGVIGIHKGIRLPLLKIASFIVQYPNGKHQIHKRWKDVLFEVNTVTAEDWEKLINTDESEMEQDDGEEECQIPLEVK